MPRYLVQSQPLSGPPPRPEDVDAVVERNLLASVTWLCSYVSSRGTWSLYEGPYAEAVRRAAGASGLHVGHVDEVRVLDPFAYCQPPSQPQEKP